MAPRGRAGRDGGCPKKRLGALGRYLDGEGPAPPEVDLSFLCQEFGALPSAIKQEDPQDLIQIIDVRMAQEIRRQIEDDPSKLSPQQERFWAEIAVAQNADLPEYLAHLRDRDMS